MKKLSVVRGGVLPVALLLALAGVGCGDSNDAPIDMGRDVGTTDQGPGVDMGPAVDMGPQQDLGPADEGVDGGPILPAPQVRVVHAVSDLTTSTPGGPVPIQGIRLCAATEFGVLAQPANSNPIPELFDLRKGLPHRSVSPYLGALPAATVRVYDEARVDNDAPGALPPAVNCPLSSDGTTPPPGETDFDSDCTNDTPVPCLFQFEYDPSSLAAGSSYSLLIQGFADNTNTCPDGIGGTVPCPTGAARASLELDEDASDAVAGSARVRFFHGVHNIFPVDVCYDVDAGGPANPTTAPVSLHTTVLPGTLTGYTTMPVLAAGTGMVFLTLKDPTDLTTLTGPCALSSSTGGNGLPANVIPVFFSVANAQMSPPSPATNVIDGSVFTIFATGDSRFITAPTGTPATNPIGWANYVGRTPIPLVFFEFDASTP